MMHFARRGVFALAASGCFEQLVHRLEQKPDRRARVLRILMFHRVAEPQQRPDLYPGLISASPERFDELLSVIAARHRVVSLSDVLEASAGAPLPPRAVLLTFDDAYHDFADHAWPVLEKLKLPAVLFVPTHYPDQPARGFWWDRLHNAYRQRGHWNSTSLASLLQRVKRMPHEDAQRLVDQICQQAGAAPPQPAVLGWDTLRSLAARGLAIAPHTQTHPQLDRLPLDAAVREAVDSLNDLRRQLGDAPRVLAYPGGAHTRQLAARLREAGFTMAMTTRRGVNRLDRVDPMRLRRINVGYRTPPALVRAQLL